MQRKLTIYYTSDVHGYFSPVDYASGKSAESGLANCMNGFANDGNTIIIDGGDILQGSPLTYYLYSQRRDGDCVPARLLNLGGYDFVTLGNHDFNYGKAEIERYLRVLDAVCPVTSWVARLAQALASLLSLTVYMDTSVTCMESRDVYL